MKEGDQGEDEVCGEEDTRRREGWLANRRVEQVMETYNRHTVTAKAPFACKQYPWSLGFTGGPQLLVRYQGTLDGCAGSL